MILLVGPGTSLLELSGSPTQPLLGWVGWVGGSSCHQSGQESGVIVIHHVKKWDAKEQGLGSRTNVEGVFRPAEQWEERES